MRATIARWSMVTIALLGAIGCSEATATGGTMEEGRRGAGQAMKLEVEARRVKLDAPRDVPVGSDVVRTSEVIEFRVTAAEPIPARALDPVLVVGERQITEYRYEAPNVLVFVEPRPDRLEPGAEVIVQWGREAPPLLQTRTGVRFDPARVETAAE